MAKGGRPMIMDAIRYACGKINQAETDRIRAAEQRQKSADETGTPSRKVKDNRDLWNAKCFKGGGQGHHGGDAIGQLWLLGKLQHPDTDDTRLLGAARVWWHGRGVLFKGLDYKVASFERASRTSNASTKLSKPERDYQRYTSFLLDASDYEQDCLADLMETTIDGDFPCWVSRIVQTELLKFVRFAVAELACDDDYARLAAAKMALLAMAGIEARLDRAA